MTDWIPVGERLPPWNGPYLVTLSVDRIWIAHYANGTWHCDGDIVSHVLAWMPLPEPYQPPDL